MILFATAHVISRNLPGNLAFFVLGISALGIFAVQRRAGLQLGEWSSLTVIIFGALDWLMFAALPRLGLSFGPTRTSLMWISLARCGVWILLAIAATLAVRLPHANLLPQQAARLSLPILWGAYLAISLVAIYALYIEPFALSATTVQLRSPLVSPQRPIRIVQLADIHVERITRREREMLEMVTALQPDLILMTGDYLNVDYVGDAQARQDARALLEQLSAPYGVYAVTGTNGVDRPEAVEEVFAGLPIRILAGETARVEIAGAPLYLVGVGIKNRADDQALLKNLVEQVPADGYTILLHHTPDLAEAAAADGIDLYLAGHTHGGQIRLPWWGAVVTLSAYGKRFEGGLYALDSMQLYVSRGIGMEGLQLPRARLLAPPEVVLFELNHGAVQAATLTKSGVAR